MTYQAYIDNIKAKTGLSPEDFRVRADEKGLLGPDVKAASVVAWLKADYGLGHGHAMAMYGTLRAFDAPKHSTDEQIGAHFSGARATWRPAYDKLVAQLEKLGPDFDVQAGKSYISLLRNGKKFAIVKVSAERLDIGIKLKGTPAAGRLVVAGRWNAMVTHRVGISRAEELDRHVLGWLREAYGRAS